MLMTGLPEIENEAASDVGVTMKQWLERPLMPADVGTIETSMIGGEGDGWGINES
jgi:hypothetical protein